MISLRQASGCGESARWVLAATILGSSLAFLEGSIVTVALPAMQAALDATAADMQWVVNAYMLFLGALILAGGSAGDLFGRRRIFVAGVALFAVGSTCCGLAPNVPALLVARAVQGAGAALLVPQSLALLSASFPSDRRGQAIGTWSGASAITTAGGPIAGGWLVDVVSWRAVFFVTVPLALATLAIALRRVPESHDATRRGGLDWPGAFLATAGLGAITYAVIASSATGLRDPRVAATLVAGLLLLAGFVAVERRSPAPMMPLALFRVGTFAGANLVTALLYGALGAAFFFLPFRLQQVEGYSATATGAALLPFALILGVLSRWSGRLHDRYGARPPLIAGPALAAAGFAALALPGIGGPYWTTFFPAVSLAGLGMAITVAPLTTAVMTAVGEAHAGVASGINNAVARVASLLAVAVLGVVAVQTLGVSLDRRLSQLHLPPAAVSALEAERTRLADARVPLGVPQEKRPAVERAIRDAFVTSFRWVVLICAALALASAGVAGGMIRDGRRARRGR